MIENVLVHFFVGAILVIVSLVALLPLQGKERLFAVSGLFPVYASRHDLSYQMVVVAKAYVILVGFSDWLQWFLQGNWLCCRTGTLYFLSVCEDVHLSHQSSTFFIVLIGNLEAIVFIINL